MCVESGGEESGWGWGGVGEGVYSASGADCFYESSNTSWGIISWVFGFYFILINMFI